MGTSLVHLPSPTLERVLANLKGVRTALRGWVACCPAHADQTPSLSIGLGEQGQVLLKCFAGCSVERIVEAMGLALSDLFPDDAASAADGKMIGAGHAPPARLTLLELALEKQLPWKFLFQLGVMEHPGGGLHIPYYRQDGTLSPRFRIRTALVAKEGSRWNKAEGRITPYGLQRLDEARKAGYLVLVEGESDCWTLWYHGFPALGLPGAEMAGILEQSALDGIDRLYIMQEPDAGGTAFLTQIVRKLEAWQWPGNVYATRLSGAKDPSALHQQGRQGFRATFQRALEQAEPLLLPSVQTVSSSTEVPKPAIFSLQDLLSWELPPMRWAIPEILPEGLTLLAGKPKLGKSWLALSVALSIAAGGVALGTQPVNQGDILYLALEDNTRRLQARARQLLASMESVPGGVEFALDWPRLGEGGLSKLEEYLKTHPTVRLVVIDTWAKIAPPSGERRNTQYEGDYQSLTPLKHLADTYRVSILAVHHLRKTGSPDVLDEITGSTGLTGAVDGMLILKRERGQAEASLFVTGRDIEHEQQLALTFDNTTAQWRLGGNVEEAGCTRARQEILALLREQQPDGMTPREIATVLKKNYHTTRSLLRKMEESGEVGRTNDGRFVSLSTDTDQDRERSLETAGPQPKMTDQRKYSEQQQWQSLGDGGGTNGIDYADYADYSDADDGDASSQRTRSQDIAPLPEIEEATPSYERATKIQQDDENGKTAVIK